MTEYIDLTPTWEAVLTRIVPAGLAHGNRDGREAAMAALLDAARKLDMLQRFIDSDDRVLRMLQDFQQQEAAQ
jgi:hypothetical protein